MTRSKLADKIDRQLSGEQEAVHLTATEWQTILEALREPLRAISSDAMNREYTLPGSASHGPR